MQFVALKDFHDDQINKRATKKLSLSEVNDLLSREVLAEIPAQITSYFELKGIPPAAPAASDTPIVAHDPNQPPTPPPIKHAVSLPPSYSQVFAKDAQNGKFVTHLIL